MVNAQQRGFWGCDGCVGGDGALALSSSGRRDSRIASSRSLSLSISIFDSIVIDSGENCGGGVGDGDEGFVGDGHEMCSEAASYFTGLETTSQENIDQKFQTRETRSNPRIYRKKAYRSFGIPGRYHGTLREPIVKPVQGRITTTSSQDPLNQIVTV